MNVAAFDLPKSELKNFVTYVGDNICTVHRGSESSVVDGGNDGRRAFILLYSAHMAYVNQLRVLVVCEGYHVVTFANVSVNRTV